MRLNASTIKLLRAHWRVSVTVTLQASPQAGGSGLGSRMLLALARR